MPRVRESQTGSKRQQEEVLTLPEAASYLRVPEEALAKLAADDALPAQKIGDEWRFLKSALAVWLASGRRYGRDMHGLPPWVFAYPFVDELVHLIVQCVRSELALTEQPPIKPGSKEAVLQAAGMWKDDPWVQGALKTNPKKPGPEKGAADADYQEAVEQSQPV
jgi:excisionase family DNA binding protein